MIALWCTQEDPSLRPTMKTVSLMLEGVLEVPVPLDPSSFVCSKSVVLFGGGQGLRSQLLPIDELLKLLVIYRSCF
ncbi:unnamed protein product, partial [Thlaspi arvense]